MPCAVWTQRAAIAQVTPLVGIEHTTATNKVGDERTPGPQGTVRAYAGLGQQDIHKAEEINQTYSVYSDPSGEHRETSGTTGGGSTESQADKKTADNDNKKTRYGGFVADHANILSDEIKQKIAVSNADLRPFL